MPFDGPAAGLHHLAGLDQRRQHRADRVGEHHLGLRRIFPEEPAEAGQRAAGADADDYRVDILAELLQNFRAGGGLVGERVGGIGELVDVERAGSFGSDLLRHVLVIFGVALADVGAGQAHLGAKRAQVLDLFAAHLVGHDEDDAVALRDADLGETKPGVAGGRLDDGAARREAPVALGVGDHRQRDAILDRAAGVLALELDEQPAFAGVELGELNHRRLADEIEDGRIRLTQA